MSETKRIVIKISGDLTDRSTARKIAKQIRALHRAGNEIVVVPGGGKQANEALAARGFAAAYDKVGIREKQQALLPYVVDAIFENCVKWQKIIGRQCVLAKNHIIEKVDRSYPDKTYTCLDAFEIEEIIAKRSKYWDEPKKSHIVVAPSVAKFIGGVVENINADEFAALVATEIKADTLIILNKAGGLQVLSWKVKKITGREIYQLIGKAERLGLQRSVPKLYAAAEALNHAATSVHITSPENLTAAATWEPGTKLPDGTHFLHSYRATQKI